MIRRLKSERLKYDLGALLGCVTFFKPVFFDPDWCSALSKTGLNEIVDLPKNVMQSCKAPRCYFGRSQLRRLVDKDKDESKGKDEGKGKGRED